MTEGALRTVAVVGAGVFGAWTAKHLRRAGLNVTLIDASGPAHARSSSGDETRLIRAAYGPDALYSRMALDSLAEWHKLSDGCTPPLFIRSGILFMFDEADPYLAATLATHRRLGLPTRLMNKAEIAEAYPIFELDGIDCGLFEAEFGALLARRSLHTLVERLVASNITYVQAQVEPPSENSDRLDVLWLKSGERIEADAFVFACGSWLPRLFPDAIGARIAVTRQEVFYFEPPPGGAFRPDAMPGWADFNRGDMAYGLPDIEGQGVKFARDRHGDLADPDTQDRQPSEAALESIIAYRDRRFPKLRDARLIHAHVCQYENSSNGDFLIDFHPNLANVLIVGAGSGHGFKHGPAVGRYAAQRLIGGEDLEPRFGFASKSETHRREVH